MQEQVSCLIADDDEVDRLTTVSFVRRIQFLKIDGVYAEASQVLQAVARSIPKVLFLDIDMPGISGLELRERLRHIPVCIFITSHPEYAVESFEKEAFDFIVKPIKRDRFDRMAERLEQYLTLHHKAAVLDRIVGDDTIFIKEGHEQIKVQSHEILYLEALKDYTRIVTASRKYCVLSALGNLLKEIPFQTFIRIHRSYAVRKEYVRKFTTSSVWVNDFELPVGRTYKDILPTLTQQAS